MHSFLISGGTEKERTEKIEALCRDWHIAPFDRFRIEEGETSTGIAAVREFIKQSALKPQKSDWYVGVIPHADTLTQEAQQALLKTLEEPPPHGRIIMAVSTSDGVLPTILSRMQHIQLASTSDGYTTEEKEACWQLITALLAQTPGQRLARLTKVAKTKDDAINWLMLAIVTLAHFIPSAPTEQQKALSHLSHRLLHAKKLTANNVQPLLLLEHVFLT